ncbi:MAG: TlpA family protein disulfide reductase [Chloroflexi bacterium]|nr:TlpA family protein disulfide reductase [Chloroflexota bacterium]
MIDSLGSNGESTRALPDAGDFHLKLFDGGEVRLSELRGKPVVVNFWASWCPPCQDEAPVLEKAWRTYKDKGVVFLGVDVQDSESDARAFIKKYGLTYSNGPDDSRRILEDWMVTNIPTTFFINREGKILRKWVGPLNETQLSILVESLLK